MARDAMIAANALQFAEEDEKQAAKLLGISPAVFQVALKEKDPSKALPEALSQKIHNNFTQNVAIRDSLTGLYNKSQFECLAHDLLQQGKPMTLLYLDLNKFKPINDTHGHEAGNVVLKTIADRLRQNIDKKSLVARLGGDEFAILLNNITEANAEKVVQRLQAKIAEPIALVGKEVVSVGASIGLASSPDDSNKVQTLLQKADERMYREKGR